MDKGSKCLLWERTLEFQVLALITEAGERGISQRELLAKLGCKVRNVICMFCTLNAFKASRKVIASLCKGLMTNLGFKAKSVQEGKQAIYYYVAPEYLRHTEWNNFHLSGMQQDHANSSTFSKTQHVTNLQNEMRTKNIMEHIREEKVLNLSDLGHLLASWEEAPFSRVDKKTVRRLIERLQEAGLIKVRIGFRDIFSFDSCFRYCL